MRRSMLVVAVVMAVTAGVTAIAQMHPPKDDLFDRQLFPPHLILENQSKLGLSAEQVGQIKKLLADTHTRAIDRQIDLQAAAERMKETLRQHPVDEARALEAAESVMGLEQEIKRIHLSMLICLKNLLTESQVRQLEEMR